MESMQVTYLRRHPLSRRPVTVDDVSGSNDEYDES